MDDLSSENNDYDFNIKKCIFCLKGFSTSNPCVRNPNLSKLDTLFQSCKARADYIGSQILANQEFIKDGSLPLRYHRNCRATYQSLYHQSFSSTRRSASNAFDWKSQCFICGEKCDTIRDPSNKRPGRSWSMVETSIDSSHNSTYSKVLKAAEIKNDTSLINRLRSVSNGDLVALEARYHRKKGCLTKYYDTNLKTDQINSNVAHLDIDQQLFN
ncbi:hypothetical protein MAR_027747 [Mya arenaria]|uniref:Uncharacterized protein n=1 Tax=Mya arenaria TaxID=6604 RepID=A0ABY7EUC9_MYAAR|nr:hypothetical protein MAR_027747 [Mya arenaria]